MPRSFTSSTHFEWIADKNGELNLEDKETIPVSVPGHFGGDDDKVNPEELLAGAVDACFGLTFFGYLSRSGAEVREFEVRAEGHYEKGKNGWSSRNLFLIPGSVLVLIRTKRNCVNCWRREKRSVWLPKY